MLTINNNIIPQTVRIEIRGMRKRREERNGTAAPELFREVAAVENITKAAKKLYVSQPALSTAIARLEKELIFLLFERKGTALN